MDCVRTVEEIWVYLFASGWDAPAPYIHFPNENSDLQCGTKEKPEKCLRMWGLNPDYKYELKLRTPDDYEFSHANGEAKNGSIRVDASNSHFLILTAEPVQFSYKIVSEIRPNDPSNNRADATYYYIGAYLQSTRSGQSQWLSSCNYGKEMSFWYSGQLLQMPSWSAKDQVLTIQVDSMHLRSDNSVNAGVFNIEMPINTAKCLWGVDLSKAVNASLSASYPELGISEVVTTSSSLSGNYFRVSASGFHFSSPTLKLKVTQETLTPPVISPQTPSALPSASPTQIANKLVKKTIICAKGKLSKKITGLNPICPTGYSKK